jgi:hypothetical protein
VLNYPIAQKDLAGLVGELINQPTERITVGNGAAELIKIITGLKRKLIVPVSRKQKMWTLEVFENHSQKVGLGFNEFVVLVAEIKLLSIIELETIRNIVGELRQELTGSAFNQIQ